MPGKWSDPSQTWSDRRRTWQGERFPTLWSDDQAAWSDPRYTWGGDLVAAAYLDAAPSIVGRAAVTVTPSVVRGVEASIAGAATVAVDAQVNPHEDTDLTTVEPSAPLPSHTSFQHHGISNGTFDQIPQAGFDQPIIEGDPDFAMPDWHGPFNLSGNTPTTDVRWIAHADADVPSGKVLRARLTPTSEVTLMEQAVEIGGSVAGWEGGDLWGYVKASKDGGGDFSGGGTISAQLTSVYLDQFGDTIAGTTFAYAGVLVSGEALALGQVLGVTPVPLMAPPDARYQLVQLRATSNLSGSDVGFLDWEQVRRFPFEPVAWLSDLRSPTMFAPGRVVQDDGGIFVNAQMQPNGISLGTIVLNPYPGDPVFAVILPAAAGHPVGLSVTKVGIESYETASTDTPSSGRWRLRTDASDHHLYYVTTSGEQRLDFVIGTDVEAYNALLAAIAGLSSNGLIARTGSGAAAARSIAVGSGLSVSNGDGVSGNPTLDRAALTGDVTATAGGNATSIAARAVTAAKMFAASATSKFLLRKTASGGDWEEGSAADAKTILGITTSDVSGLGTVATLASDTDGLLAANSDGRVATQKATKTYVDAAVTGLLEFKGTTDCSANPNYPAASKGDAYVVSVAGKIGGASGKTVAIGDWYVATADNAGGTEASVGTSWTAFEHNIADLATVATTGSASDLGTGTLPFARISSSDITTAARTVLDDTTVAAMLATMGGAPLASPSFTGTVTTAGDIELGNASDTTIHRVSAGVASIEGSNILVSGGALGTPSSGTGTNLTGIPAAGTTFAATSRVLGRISAGAGAGEELTAANLKTILALAAADLSDYVAPTAWTPVLKFGGASTGITGTLTGLYTRTGRTVTGTVSLQLTSKGSATGVATITGLPLAPVGFLWGNRIYDANSPTLDLYPTSAFSGGFDIGKGTVAGTQATNADFNNNTFLIMGFQYTI